MSRLCKNLVYLVYNISGNKNYIQIKTIQIVFDEKFYADIVRLSVKGLL